MASSLLLLYLKTAFSDYMVLSVLVLLLFMSVLSWALFFYKLIQFKSVSSKEKRIHTLVEDEVPLKTLLSKRYGGDEVPFSVLLKIISEDINKLSKSCVESAELIAQTKLERGLGILATIGSTAPFVGLFGTVWGIMKAFHMIGLQGSASLAVVAPGISEALVNTALGLFVAIPAVFFYNFLSRRLDAIMSRFKAYAYLFVERYGGKNEKESGI